MSLFDNPDSLRLLQNLLNPQESKEDSDLEEEDEGRPLLQNQIDPGTIATRSAAVSSNKNTSKSPYTQAETAEAAVNKVKLFKSFEEWQLCQDKENAALLDNRKIPEYQISYRQAIGTEDVYLQMGNRSASSASCEDMILDIHLPDETVSVDKMQLAITEMEIDLATPIYHLKLPLMHKVNVDRCNAKYESDLRKLCLTLRLQRDLDFVNF